MRELADAIGTFIGGVIALAISVLAVVIGACIGAVIGGLVGEFTYGDHKMPPTSGLVGGAILGGLAVAIPLLSVYVVGPLRDRARDAAYRRKAAEDASQHARQAVIAQRAQAAEAVLTNSRNAVARFETMPGHVTSAEADAGRALACYQDGAFSPFWSAIESAYSHLAEYRACAEAIESCARAHPDLVRAFVQAQGDPAAVAGFPVTLNAESVADTLEAATQSLGTMVYEAQKQPTFAQIWEQRRTTAAVITGFANLEQAVNRMGSSITSSIRSLSASLERTHTRMEAIARESSAVSVGLAGAQQDQVMAMRDLTAKAGQIKAELYHQTWGHYPILG